MSKKLYVTTTLPYVNSDPHVGFAIFLFYLVRDTILYIIIPVLIARGIIAH
jgi:methionyl-tRNA synthetase